MDNIVYIYGMLRVLQQNKEGIIVCEKSSGIIKNILYNHEDIKSILLKYKENKDKLISFDKSLLIMKGDFNAHTHPEQSLYTELIDKSWDLSTWCRNTIYKYSPILKPEDIYKGCYKAFTNMLKLGVTSCMASFYCHGASGNAYDMEAIRAAKDSGIRLYFGRMNYDIIDDSAYEAKKASQKSYHETPAEAALCYKELLNCWNFNTIEIAPAIHSLHASSKEAIINAINLGIDYNKYVQFHLSEDKNDVALCLKLYNMLPVHFLVSLYEEGYVKALDHVILSDCIWVNDEELSLIKKYHMKVVINPRMNNRIKAGTAPLKSMLTQGIAPYLGTDGEASNDDLSVTGEYEFLKKKYKKEIPMEQLSSLNSLPFKFKNSFISSSIEANTFCDLKILKDEIPVNIIVGGKTII